MELPLKAEAGSLKRRPEIHNQTSISLSGTNAQTLSLTKLE